MMHIKRNRPLPKMKIWYQLSIAVIFSTAVLFTTSVKAAGVVVTGGGLDYVQEGPAVALAGDAAQVSLATGAIAFALDTLVPGVHDIDNLNDGLHGNSTFSWIGSSTGTEGQFAGIDLGAVAIANVQSIAFGRSNVLGGDPCGGGVCTDRNFGLYTLQYTQFANPSTNLGLVTGVNAATDWVTIGTIDNQGFGGQFTAPHLRHRYNFTPVSATGIRMIVPTGTAIDEIELYDVAGANTLPPPPQPIELNPAAGFQFTWDGNDGDHFDAASPAVVPDNLALASNGAAPFTSSDLAIGNHFAPSINNGLYGNNQSWISGTGDPQPSAGVNLDGSFGITSIAWGRDNGNNVADDCGGQCPDRTLGTYTIQVTTDPNPTNASAWTTIATVDYNFDEDADVGSGFTSYFRHEFDVATDTGAPIQATGVRIIVPVAGIAGGTAIDEIEVYGVPEPSSVVLLVLGALGLIGFTRRRK